MKIKNILLLLSVSAILGFACSTGTALDQHRTTISIQGDDFYINGEITYRDRSWQGHRIEGLLMNARLVQGIFDDENQQTRVRWKYPDTNEWDPERNTREFVAAMPDWKAHGLLSFTVNLQGGSPMGYGNKNWKNTAYSETGELKPAYMNRLQMILDAADSLEMVPILSLFYFGQDQFLQDEQAILTATDNVIDWLFDQGYRNVLIETANEINVSKYDHEIFTTERAHELIKRIKKKSRHGYRFLVGTSYGGGFVPRPNVVKVSDFLLIHGNDVNHPDEMRKLIEATRAVEGFTEMPVIVNEDDHYDYDESDYNLKAAIEKHVSWGFFDFRRNDEPFGAGFQSVPVDWRISHLRKEKFFDKIKEITGY